MLKLSSNPRTAGAVDNTDELRKFTREHMFTQRLETWQVWTVIMAFTAMFLAAAILTMV